MHLKDGSPAKIGDIVKHESGSPIGLIIGGNNASARCNLTLLTFAEACNSYSQKDAFAGAITDNEGKIVQRGAAVISQSTCMTASEYERIGSVNLGNS